MIDLSAWYHVKHEKNGLEYVLSLKFLQNIDEEIRISEMD